MSRAYIVYHFAFVMGQLVGNTIKGNILSLADFLCAVGLQKK